MTSVHANSAAETTKAAAKYRVGGAHQAAYRNAMQHTGAVDVAPCEVGNAEIGSETFDDGDSVRVNLGHYDIHAKWDFGLNIEERDAVVQVGLPFLVVLGEVAKHRLRQHSDRLFDTAVNKSQFLCRRALLNLLTHYSGQQPYSKTSTIQIGSISSVIRAGFIGIHERSAFASSSSAVIHKSRCVSDGGAA